MAVTNVVPLPNKRLEAIKAALASVAPDALPERVEHGAGVILATLTEGARTQKAADAGQSAEEWEDYPLADGPIFEGWKPGLAGLLEYANSPMAHALGLPPRYARDVHMEAWMVRGAPGYGPNVTHRELQDAALRIYYRRKTPPGVWEAYTVLRVARDLRASDVSDGRLTVYEKNGEPVGKALPYVRAIHAAASRPRIEGTHWPAAYIHADRLIQATDRRFVPTQRKEYPRLVVIPNVEEASSSVGCPEDCSSERL